MLRRDILLCKRKPPIFVVGGVMLYCILFALDGLRLLLCHFCGLLPAGLSFVCLLRSTTATEPSHSGVGGCVRSAANSRNSLFLFAQEVLLELLQRAQPDHPTMLRLYENEHVVTRCS